MNKRIIVPVFILVFVLSACAQAVSTTPSPSPSSGIEGIVTEGPTCPGPVVVGDNSCPDKPYQATIVILNSDNEEITRFQTDAAGHFEISLLPGNYIIHPLSEKTLPFASDQTVVVAPDKFTEVNITYDTGIR